MSGEMPQISVITGTVGRRRLLLAGAHRLRGDDRGRGDVPHRSRQSCARSRARTFTPATSAGREVHERNGVCQFVADDDVDSIWLVRELLALSAPARRRDRRRGAPPADPDGARPGGTWSRATARGSYDVRDVDPRDRRRRVAARGRARAGRRNIVTALARIEGRPVGVIANQPRQLGGVIDAEGVAEGRASSFARATRTACRSSCSSTRRASCPGTEQEGLGVIRHGAKLLHAFAEATVPAASRSCCARPTAARTSR